MSTAVAFEGLYADGKGPQRLLLDGKKLSFEELGGGPAKDVRLDGAVFETRKRFGIEFLWLGILLFFAAGIGLIFIILYYYVKKDVLVAVTSDGREIAIKGKRDVLDDLHYLIQKNCLKDLPREEDAPRRRSGGKQRSEKGTNKGAVLVLTCPECGSDRLYYEAAYHTGRKYHCKNCDYIGAFVVEKAVDT